MWIGKTKQIWMTVMLWCLCALLLISCGTGEAGGADTVTGTGTEVLSGSGQGEDSPGETEVLILTQEGKSPFKIIRKENAGDDLVTLCKNIHKSLSNYAGVNCAMGDDFIGWSQSIDSEAFEILVGTTNRPESAKALEGLKYDEFFVGVIGHKIVINGVSPNALENAVDYFINHIVMERGEKGASGVTITISEADNRLFKKTYQVSDFDIAGVSVADYVLVLPAEYSASEYRFALRWRELLGQYTGFFPELIYDKTPQTGREIRVGNTSRSAGGATGHDYACRLNGDHLELSAGSVFGYEAMLKYWDTQLNVAKSGKKLVISAGFSASGTATNVPVLTVQREGEIRVMFNNCYGSCDASLYPIKQRMLQLDELYLQYLPDVIGLQECSTLARQNGVVTRLEKDDVYREVPAETKGKNNFTPLLYRPDVLKLLDCGFKIYDDGKGDQSKSVTWAVFETLASGKRFAVCSTHFWWKSDNQSSELARLEDVAELTAIEKDIIAKYGVGIISGGDLNCNLTSQPMRKLLSTDHVDMQYKAPKANKTNTHHSYSPYDFEREYYRLAVRPAENDFDKSIDHILQYGTGVTVNRFEVVTHDYALLSSDHCPIFVDMDLN